MQTKMKGTTVLDIVMCLYLLKKAERHAEETQIKGAQYFGASIELGTDGSGVAEIAPYWRGESYQAFHCSWETLREMLPAIRKAVNDYVPDEQTKMKGLSDEQPICNALPKLHSVGRNESTM